MNQTIGVNITPQSFQPTLHYSQGDVGRVFVINVTDYDIPTGATVTCVATKPSGMGFTVSGTVSGNSVTFTSTAEMTDEWGRFPAEIRIASGNTLLGTANFLMIGEKDPHPASTIDGTQEELIPQLTLLVNRVEAAAESVHDLTVSATTLTAGSDATATYDSTNNSIAFGIPRGADGDVTRSEFNDLKSELSESVGDYSANLYNINADTLGKVINGSGSIVDNANYRISDLIYIGEGNTFTFDMKRGDGTGVNYVCYYDSNESFYSRVSVEGEGSKTITMGSGRDYVRLCILVDTPDFMCNLGSTLLTYSPYGFKYSSKFDTYIKDAVIEELGDIPEDVATLKDYNFPTYVGEHTGNLYDITKDTLNKVINNSGEIVDNDSYRISDYIYIGEGNTFTFQTKLPTSSDYVGVINVSYYDASKQFVTRVAIADEGTRTITMASGREYIRFNIKIDTPDFMCNMGSSILPYKPYFAYSDTLDQHINNLIDEYGLLSDKTKRVNFSRSIDDRYSFSGTVPTHDFDAINVTTAQIYQLYDSLKNANSDYISMEEIGTASDGQKLRAYTLRSNLPPSGANRRRVRALIVCGQHGWEKSSTETMLMVMQEICNHWKTNAFYECFMYDVELTIIPIANPYGFDHDTRKNGNGVDLNRNYPVDWGRFPTTPSDVDYAGTNALSEPESSAIYAYLQRFEEPFDFAFDFHEFGKANGRATWVETLKGKPRMAQLAQLYAGIVRRMITEKYSVLSDADMDTLAYSSDTYGNGRLSATLGEFADYSCTFEVAGEMPLDPSSVSSSDIQRFTDDHVKLCLDLFSNFYCVMLRESRDNSYF